MPKILCVEDDPRLLEILVDEVESAGYEVVVATNGREGIEKTVSEKPDLIISDIRMPDMDGYQFLTALRLEHPEAAWTPFIFLTALSEQQDIVRGKALGADDYMTKPVDYEMLLATIGSRLQQIQRIAEQHDKDMVRLYNKLTGSVDSGNANDAAEESPISNVPVAEPDPLDTRPLVIASMSEQDDLDLLKEMGASVGFRFEAYINGPQCLARLKQSAPSVLLVSYRTDGLSGLVLGKEAAALHPDLPVVLVVAPELGVVPNVSKLGGFSDSMSFPCSDADLQAVLQKWLTD